jgi:hypothetical protein
VFGPGGEGSHVREQLCVEHLHTGDHEGEMLSGGSGGSIDTHMLLQLLVGTEGPALVLCAALCTAVPVHM